MVSVLASQQIRKEEDENFGSIAFARKNHALASL